MPIYKMPGKKDGKQKYKVRINYMDSHGKYKQMDRIAYGAEEAKELERQLTSESKEVVSGGKITVSELYTEYYNSKKHDNRESTMKKFSEHIEKYVVPFLGENRIDKLTIPMFQEWKNTVNELVSSKTGEKLSLRYKQAIYTDLNSLLNYAVKMEYITRNALRNLGTFKDAYAEKSEMLYYTVDEFKKFIAVAENEALKAESKGNIYLWHYYVFFNIAFYMGMRKGEIYALRWSDIEDNIMHIKRSITQKLKGDDRETPPKNKSSVRDVQIPAPLLNILAKHKKRCSQLANFSQSVYICGVDKPVRDSTVDKKNTDFAEQAGLKKIRIHDFRHSHASVLVNEGINIQEIARRLGHSNIEITLNTYAHLYPREEERAIQILNKI